MYERTKMGQASMYERYFDQVRLLLSVLPDIAREDAFALKGGTAINLFYVVTDREGCRRRGRRLRSRSPLCQHH